MSKMLHDLDLIHAKGLSSLKKILIRISYIDFE